VSAVSAHTERQRNGGATVVAFVQNCGKTAEKVRVLNTLTGKSVGVKTPTSPTGARPLYTSMC